MRQFSYIASRLVNVLAYCRVYRLLNEPHLFICWVSAIAARIRAAVSSLVAASTASRSASASMRPL